MFCFQWRNEISSNTRTWKGKGRVDINRTWNFFPSVFVCGGERAQSEYLKKIGSLGSVENTLCDTISLSTTAFSIGQVCIAVVEPAQLWLMYVISVMLLYFGDSLNWWKSRVFIGAFNFSPGFSLNAHTYILKQAYAGVNSCWSVLQPFWDPGASLCGCWSLVWVWVKRSQEFQPAPQFLRVRGK